VAEPWNFNNCKAYIEWYLISRGFPHHCYELHRKADKANLHSCKWPIFKERCIEMCQHIYDTSFLERDECPLSILRMVYAEVVIGKQVDWGSVNIQTNSNMRAPLQAHFGPKRKFPDKRLGKKMPSKKKPNELVVWSTTSSDDKKTGCT
jgi:hypothetical protein